MQSRDTIAAVSTASGRAGIGIVRVSGPEALAIASRICRVKLVARQFAYTSFYDSQGEVIDFGIVLYFARPASYTGEDVVEFQGHGGSAVLDLMLNTCIQAGARLAKPGEFTERAFLNDKLDLAQAEAVIDLIESANETAARAAVKSLSGKFSDEIALLNEQLIELRVYIEAALDFSEEEIDFLSGQEVKNRTKNLQQLFDNIMKCANQGQLLRDGMTLVIAGRPNVGKSSLLNALTGKSSAIVTDVAGTTRDVLREQIHLDGLPLHIVDTAGLHASDDKVEQEGIRRAQQEISEADRILLVTDGQDDASLVDDFDFPPGIPRDRIFNKADLTGVKPSLVCNEDGVNIHLSAKTGDGVSLLVDHLKSSVGYQQNIEGVFSARTRHIDALNRAKAATEQALSQLKNGQMPELAAQDLREAQQALNEITGEFTSDDLLGRIFAGFCIGK